MKTKEKFNIFFIDSQFFRLFSSFLSLGAGLIISFFIFSNGFVLTHEQYYPRFLFKIPLVFLDLTRFIVFLILSYSLVFISGFCFNVVKFVVIKFKNNKKIVLIVFAQFAFRHNFLISQTIIPVNTNPIINKSITIDGALFQQTNTSKPVVINKYNPPRNKLYLSFDSSSCQ
jgi:hypothetical protein